MFGSLGLSSNRLDDGPRKLSLGHLFKDSLILSVECDGLRKTNQVVSGGAALYLVWLIFILALKAVLSGTAMPIFISLPLTPNFQLSRANYTQGLHQARLLLTEPPIPARDPRSGFYSLVCPPILPYITNQQCDLFLLFWQAHIPATTHLADYVSMIIRAQILPRYPISVRPLNVSQIKQ